MRPRPVCTSSTIKRTLTFVAKRPDRLEVALAGRPYPTLALDRLEHHGRHFGCDRLVECSDILPGDVAEPFGQRLKGLVLGGLAGGVKRGQGAPVERPVGTHHDVTPVTPPFPGQLNGALVGFGAAIGEENPCLHRR